MVKAYAGTFSKEKQQARIGLRIERRLVRLFEVYGRPSFNKNY